MTGLSVFIALFIGLVEVAQIVIQVLGLNGPLPEFVARLNFG